jgi:hypothetical protein
MALILTTSLSVSLCGCPGKTLLATKVEFLKQTEQAVELTVAESSLRPPKPIMRGGCCGGQFKLHDVDTIEESIRKALT